MGRRARGQLESFGHALSGIAATVAGELHMKVHVVIAVCALAACALLRVDWAGWCIVVMCIGAVFAAEIVNTAIEAVCDKVSPEFDAHIKLAKDAAAGAVLVLACMAVVAGAIVYLHAVFS